MDTFTSAYDEKIRPIMDKIDQVRSILPDGIDGVTFPTVVVVGDQSSGKSTLLESLSLVELPKGSGIVTRCPLVLRLRQSSERRVYHLQGGDQKKIVLDEKDINIMKYIEDETRKLAGANKNVVKDLIELQVEDPNVRDLTVVDLPGIARNPIGDQPKNIHSQTTDLIRHFIRQEGSVILCVFPVDVATVESFTLAREVDPFGIRTIGVITKSDLAPNDDTLCQQLLMEKKDVLQLKLGFVAVRNRTADEKLNLKEAREREKQFFRNHAASSVVGWHCLGIDALINCLADLYADRVKETFPKMRAEIQKKVIEIRERLSKYPPDLDTPSVRLAKYHELADFYVEDVLKDRVSSSSGLVNSLHFKFKKLEKIIEIHTLELYTNEYRDEVESAISACFGEQLPNFLPQHILKQLMDKKINQLWYAASYLIKDCFVLTSTMLLRDKYLSQGGDLLFSKLLPAFRNIASAYLKEQMQAVHDQLHGLICLERHEPYTLNGLYMDTINKQKDENSDENNKVSIDEETVNEMVLSIRSYWTVLTQRFLDYVALSVRAGCVFNVCAGIRERLRRVPAEQIDFVDSFLAEDAHTRAHRKKLQKTYERLEKVLGIIGNNLEGTANGIFPVSTRTGTELDKLDIGTELDALEHSLRKGLSDPSAKILSEFSTQSLHEGLSKFDINEGLSESDKMKGLSQYNNIKKTTMNKRRRNRKRYS